MNKHNVFGFLAVFLSLAAFSVSAHSETLAERSYKNIETHVSQKCTSNNLDPALCACEMSKVKSAQFSVFTKTLKTDADFPKLDAYYVQKIVVPCVLNRGVSQKLCIHHMKSKTSEYTDQVVNDYCECVAEEVGENVSRASLKAKDRFEIMAVMNAESEKAHKVCDMVRVK
ncbi:MAG: hypothetical protein KA155_07625 [Alphaproteobacteria bacterium]|jgi:hypothetical protein|nr:hypothetical protein [Alphaproteobacteria bacterium]